MSQIISAAIQKEIEHVNVGYCPTKGLQALAKVKRQAVASYSNTAQEVQFAYRTPDKLDIQCIDLKIQHVEQIETEWRNCMICRDRLDADAAQMRCCQLLLHRLCLLRDVDEVVVMKAATAHYRCIWCRKWSAAIAHDLSCYLTGNTLRISNAMKRYLPFGLGQFGMMTLKTRRIFMAFAEMLHAPKDNALAWSLEIGEWLKCLLKTCNTWCELVPVATLLLSPILSCGTLRSWFATGCRAMACEGKADITELPVLLEADEGQFQPKIVARLRRHDYGSHSEVPQLGESTQDVANLNLHGSKFDLYDEFKEQDIRETILAVQQNMIIILLRYELQPDVRTSLSKVQIEWTPSTASFSTLVAEALRSRSASPPRTRREAWNTASALNDRQGK